MNEELLAEIDSLMRGDPPPDSLRGLALLILSALQEREELRRSVANYHAMERAMLDFTRHYWSKHPREWGDLACECATCLSYADREEPTP